MNQIIYEPHKWNDNIFIRKSHNCYSYALNIIEKKKINECKKILLTQTKCLRKQPNNVNKKYEFHSCSELIENIILEYPQIKIVNKNTPCPEGFYRVVLFLIKRFDNHHLTLNDFHFYRQDSDGFWSHKDGWRKATNKDKQGNLITDPEIIDNEIDSYLCCYFIFPIEKK